MINSKLLQKSFDLKKTAIYGGTSSGTTATANCHTQDGCTDVITETYGEKGEKLTCCITYDCPDPT